MNQKLKAVSSAVLLGLSAGSAYAASNAGLPANGAQVDPGDLVFAYEAADGQTSVVWDLSNGSDDLTWGSILQASSFTISNDIVSHFVTGNPGGRWNVFSLTNTKQSGTGSSLLYGQAGFGLTINGTPLLDGVSGTGITGGKIEAYMDTNAQWIANANFGGLPDNGALLATISDSWGFSSNFHGGDSGTLADQHASGMIGDTLFYWTILIDDTVTRGLSSNPSNAQGRAPTFTQLIDAQGQAMGFTLAADGSLTFAPTPVPVPAAVWLMGSAIAGLGVLRRRTA